MQRAIRKAVVLALCAFGTVLPQAQERGLEVTAKKVAGSDVRIGKQYAVLIAIDRYAEWTPLRTPVRDAKEIKRILEKRYYIDNIIELYDGEATAAGIRRLFSRLIDQTGPTDSVLIYYAGHGYTDKFKTGFWIPADGGKDVENQDRWIPNQQIRNFVSQIKARSVALVSDSCFSGDLLNVHRGTIATPEPGYVRDSLKYTSRQVLTSGASESVPDESEFSRQFKKTLELNTEAYLDPLSMYDRIRRGVSKTLPLLGTLPGQEDGGNYLLFLREEPAPGSAAKENLLEAPKSTEPVQLPPKSTVKTETEKIESGSLIVTAKAPATLYVDGAIIGVITQNEPRRIENIPTGSRTIEASYADGHKEGAFVEVGTFSSAQVDFRYVIERPQSETKAIHPVDAGDASSNIASKKKLYSEVIGAVWTDSETPVYVVDYKFALWNKNSGFRYGFWAGLFLPPSGSEPPLFPSLGFSIWTPLSKSKLGMCFNIGLFPSIDFSLGQTLRVRFSMLPLGDPYVFCLGAGIAL